MHIIAYIENNNAKNSCFIVNSYLIHLYLTIKKNMTHSIICSVLCTVKIGIEPHRYVLY